MPDAMTASEARALTNEVRADTERLWAKLLQLHSEDAHTALGYDSWAAYCAEEFGFGRSRAYQILDAAKVVAVLGESTVVDGARVKLTERVARELAPLRDNEEQLRATWSETVERFGDQPTAAQVRVVRTGDTVPLLSAPPRLVVASGEAGDVRFQQIEDAVALLQLLPDATQIVFPDDSGDVEAIAEAIEWLHVFEPQLRREWRRHLQALRQHAA